MQKNAAANELRLAGRLGKNIKRSTRSSFFTPFRADRATAASDIAVYVTADDLRYFAAAVAHQMLVYTSSAFLGRIGLRAGRTSHREHAFFLAGGLCSYHGGCTREFGACVEGQRASNGTC